MNIAAQIIDAFGGTRPMAAALGLPPSTIQSWKAAKRIPAKHQSEVLSAARRSGVALTPDDFFERTSAKGHAA